MNQEQMGPWFHGTNIDDPEGFIKPGHKQNYAEGEADHVYFTNSVSGARGYANFAAAQGGGQPHVYEVSPRHEAPWKEVGSPAAQEHNRKQGVQEYKTRGWLDVNREVKD